MYFLYIHFCFSSFVIRKHNLLIFTLPSLGGISENSEKERIFYLTHRKKNPVLILFTPL